MNTLGSRRFLQVSFASIAALFTRMAFLWIAVIGASQLAVGQTGDRESVETWMPDSIVAFVTVRDLGKAWQAIEGSSAMKELLQLPDIQKLFESPRYRQAMAGKKFVENLLGGDLRALSQELTENPAIFGVDQSRESVLVMTPQKDAYARLLQTMSGLADVGTITQGGVPIRAVKYKEIPAFAIDKARIAFFDGRIVVCSGNTIGKAVLDRALDNATPSLADTTWFKSASKFARSYQFGETTLGGIVDLNAIRKFAMNEIPNGKEVAQELFFGGVLDALRSAEHAVVTANWSGNTFDFQVCLPLPKPLPENRAYFFGKSSIVPAPTARPVGSRVFSARWHRDIGEFWKLIPQLVTDENALAEVAKSESDLSTLMGGMVTVGEVFDYLGPDLEFVVSQPQFDAASDDAPDIKLPTFGLTGTLRDAQRAERALRLAFQQVVTFANFNAGPGKYPPLELITEKVESTRFLTASYLAMDNMMMSEGGGSESEFTDLYRNFNPTLAVSGDRFVLASDRGMAEQLLSRVEASSADHSTRVDNTVFELWPQELAKLAELNREPIIAQRMLETGKDRESVAREYEIGLALVRCIEKIDVALATENGALVLAAKAGLSAAK